MAAKALVASSAVRLGLIAQIVPTSGEAEKISSPSKTDKVKYTSVKDFNYWHKQCRKYASIGKAPRKEIKGSQSRKPPPLKEYGFNLPKEGDTPEEELDHTKQTTHKHGQGGLLQTTVPTK